MSDTNKTAEQTAEEKRLAAEAKKEADDTAKAEQKRLDDEKKAEDKRLADEKKAQDKADKEAKDAEKKAAADAKKNAGPLALVEKVRKAIKLARQERANGELDKAKEYQLSFEELEELRFMDGQDGRPFVKDRKQLWQMHSFMFSPTSAIFIGAGETERPVNVGDSVQFPAEFFSINGVSYKVPKGHSVEVPRQVYEMFKTDYDVKNFRVQPIDLGGNMLSAPQSYTQKPDLVWEKTNNG